jgi:ankyrin repeat protein
MEGRRADQQQGRQGNDYQNFTVREGGRGVFGNIYADSFHMSVLDGPQRPRKTKQEEQADFMKSLSFDVMDSRLATIGIAHRDTCSWLYTRAEYLRWQDPESRADHHGFLWIKGNPGAGKSTLMKHALRHAQSLDQVDTTTISFFFNARGGDLEKTTEGMYRSLLYQVYKAFPGRLPGVLSSYPSDSNNHTWQLPLLQHMLREALLNFGNNTGLIFYVDALDECDEDSIRLAIEYFEELGELAISQDVKISICFASRHYPNITMRRCQALNIDEQEDHHKDIQKFVIGKLRGTGRTHSELSKEISGRSSGIFLWAALVVQILNKKMDHGATRLQLMTDLEAVPAGIEDLLKSILIGGGDFLLPTLLWVLFGIESLSASALYLAAMIGAGRLTSEDLGQTETTQKQMRLFILNSSKGLVEFSKGFPYTAQFIHESVREHLLNGGLSVLDDSLAENLKAKSHLRLAVWCRACIELNLHRGLPAPEIEEDGFLQYALWHLYTHCDDAFEGGEDPKLEFLDTVPQTIQSWVSRNASSTSAPRTLLGLLLHEGNICLNLVEGLLRRQLRHYGQVDACATAHNDAIEAAIPYLGVNLILDVFDSTALQFAVHPETHKSKDIVQLLLNCGADPNLGDQYNTPLFLAIGNKQIEIVELLLCHGANFNLVRLSRGEKQTPLAFALAKGSKECVKMLLERGADPNVGYQIAGPLHTALRNDNCDIVELLLHHGACPNHVAMHRKVTQTPLAVALSHRCTRCATMLLERGADASGGVPATALITAIEMNVLCLVRLLLDAGADINATDTTRRTALVMAVEMGNFDIARLLVDRGANLDMHGQEGLVCYIRLRMAEEDAATRLKGRGSDVSSKARCESV